MTTSHDHAPTAGAGPATTGTTMLTAEDYRDIHRAVHGCDDPLNEDTAPSPNAPRPVVTDAAIPIDALRAGYARLWLDWPGPNADDTHDAWTPNFIDFTAAVEATLSALPAPRAKDDPGVVREAMDALLEAQVSGRYGATMPAPPPPTDAGESVDSVLADIESMGWRPWLMRRGAGFWEAYAMRDTRNRTEAMSTCVGDTALRAVRAVRAAINTDGRDG